MRTTPNRRGFLAVAALATLAASPARPALAQTAEPIKIGLVDRLYQRLLIRSQLFDRVLPCARCERRIELSSPLQPPAVAVDAAPIKTTEAARAWIANLRMISLRSWSVFADPTGGARARDIADPCVILERLFSLP